MLSRFAKIVPGDLAREGPPVTAEPVWLDVEPSVAKLVRWVSYGSIALSSACCAAPIVFILTLALAPSSRITSPESARVAHAVYVALVSCVLFWMGLAGGVYLRNLSALRLSLGSDGRRLYVRDLQKKTIAVAERSAVYTNGEFILVGRHAIPLGYLFCNAFDRERLLRYIVRGLPRSAVVSNYGFIWRAVRAGSRGVIASLVFLVMLVSWIGLHAGDRAARRAPPVSHPAKEAQ